MNYDQAFGIIKAVLGSKNLSYPDDSHEVKRFQELARQICAAANAKTPLPKKWDFNYVDETRGGHCLVMDVKKRTMRFNRKEWWIRLAGTLTSPEIYIYYKGDSPTSQNPDGQTCLMCHAETPLCVHNVGIQGMQTISMCPEDEKKSDQVVLST